MRQGFLEGIALSMPEKSGCRIMTKTRLEALRHLPAALRVAMRAGVCGAMETITNDDPETVEADPLTPPPAKLLRSRIFKNRCPRVARGAQPLG